MNCRPVGFEHSLVFAATMIALIFIDARHMILPNVITYPLFLFVILVRIVYPLFFGAEYFSDMAYFPATVMPG